MSPYRQYVVAVIAAFATLAAAPSLAQPVKLGELNSYKVFPAFLEPYKKGMELALAEVNAAGGVLGRPLEIVSRDDNGTPGDAVRVAEELTSREKVAMLIGTFPSNVGLAVADYAKQRKIPFLAAEPLTDKIVWEARQQVHVPPARFHVHADGHAGAGGGQAQPQALGHRLSQLRIRAIGDGGIQEADQRAAKRPGMEFIASQRYRWARSTPGPVVQAVLDAQPDAIFSSLFGADWPNSCAKGNCGACSRTVRCSTCSGANPSISTR